jgi:hypothetical protein
MSSATHKELNLALQIQAPGPRYFDRERNVWVLSRYRDVLAAFLEPDLWPVGTRGQDQSAGRDEKGRLVARGDFQRAFSAPRIAEWQAQVEAISAETISQLDTKRCFDLLGELVGPICLRAAIHIMGVSAEHRARVWSLGRQVFNGAGTSRTSPLRCEGEAAGIELAKLFEGAPIPGGKQTFIGITQTLPRMVVNGWVALLEHPDEMSRLRAKPELITNAVEELMRYAPTIHVISRLAMKDVELDGLSIPCGMQVNLQVASANRDGEQFPDPERLDVTRTPSTQVALGFGRDFCIGAVIVRMVYTTITKTILEAFREIALAGPVIWQNRSESCWPASASVLARRQALR